MPTRALVAGLAALGVLLAGCSPSRPGTSGAAGPAGPDVPAGAGGGASSAAALVNLIAARADTVRAAREDPSGAPVRYREVDYHATVYDMQSPRAFVAFATTTQDVTVEASSTATVRTVSSSALRFATPLARARWQAAGEPQIAGPVAGRVVTAPPGRFTFLPQGRPLTYQQAGSLPATPQAVLAAVRDRSPSDPAAGPAATVILRQLGFLLAVAPLSRGSRSAAWRALTLVPGLRLCGGTPDSLGRRGADLCVDSADRETDIVVDPATGTVLQVAERLRQPSSWFPGLPAGSLVGANTFARAS